MTLGEAREMLKELGELKDTLNKAYGKTSHTEFVEDRWRSQTADRVIEQQYGWSNDKINLT
jgi:hypothetical protein